MFVRVIEETFAELMELMEGAFPPEEFRIETEQKALLQRKEYELYYIEKDNQRKGMMAIWDFPKFIYIEHFAIAPAYQGEGLGGLALLEMIQWKKKAVVLEVELPHTEQQKRRIDFYKRYGFHQNEFAYEQPPLREEVKWLPLQLMSHPIALTTEHFEEYRKELYQEVYGIV